MPTKVYNGLPQTAKKPCLQRRVTADLIVPNMSQVIRLSPFDLIAPHDFSRQLFFFSTSHQNRDITRILVKKAFTNVLRRFPFLAGKIIPHPRDGPGHRALQLNPTIADIWDPEAEGLLKFSHCGISYEALKQDDFAAEKDEWTVFHWMPVLADPMTKQKGTPVMTAQVNFLQGGLVLAMSFDHACMDGRGYIWVYDRIREELRIASSLEPDARSVKPEGSCVGLQSFHSLPRRRQSIHKPKELRVKSLHAISDSRDAPGVTATLKFRVDGLQHMLRANGSSSSAFRCISALLFVAITRARLITNTCSQYRKPRCMVITNMRDGLSAPENAVGNSVLYGYFEKEFEEILEGGDLADLPPILSETLDSICDFIHETREPGYATQRVSYLNHQIYTLGVDPRRIGVDMEPNDNDVIFNTWEEFPTGPDEFPVLGKLDCCRKPLTFIDGYALVAPRNKDSEFVSISISLKTAAMAELLRQLAGWKARGWLVSVQQ